MASDGGENECLLSLVILWDTSSKHHTSDVIVSAVNATTAVFASLSNLAIFVTMIKKKLFSTPNDILIGSLTLVDFAAAIVAKPLYIALRMFLHHDQVACDSLRSLANVGESAFLFCVGCSVLHIVLIAGDRCVALCKPVGYRTTNAKKVATLLAGTCWINWCLFIIFVQWIIPTSAVPVVRAFMAAVLLTSLVVLKIKTAVIVVRYNRSVLVNGAYSLDVQRLTIRERKVLADTRFTLLTLMVLFIPTAVLSTVRPAGIYGSAVFPWSMTITLLNSTINPIIQLWRNRKLRHSIVEVFWPWRY